MKKLIQRILQFFLGFENYLFIFSLFKINTLKWDSKEGDFNYFVKMIPEDATVLDIGANVGIMTVPLAKHCRKGKVLAIEPIPENMRTLHRVVKHYKLKNVEFNELAIGEKAETVIMVMPVVKKVKMQGLSHRLGFEEATEDEGQVYKVKQTALDSFAAIIGERIDAIKIDVENYEQFVFMGGRETLAKHKPIIYCELWDNENRTNSFKIITSLGYDIKVLSGNELIPFDKETFEGQNFFFVPKEK